MEGKDNKTKVALLGPEGTFTHQAADMYFDNLEPVFCSSISEIFCSEIDIKFVPIENSVGGGVSDTVDLFRKEQEEITAEVRLPIRHALVSGEDSIENVETVVSHPQAISQCQEIIESKGWERREVSSTAAAVEELREGEAALASEIASKKNDKNILKTSVQDKSSNITRFFVLNGSDKFNDKSAFILEPGEDYPGLLHSMLSCFAGHQINLSHIQSRPTGEELGDYYFYVEAEEGEGKNLKKAVKCLKTYAEVKILGSYRVFGEKN